VIVTHISTFDQRGGAARAAYRLHAGLQRIGVTSRMFVADKLSQDDSVIKYEPPATPWSRIQREIRRQFLARSINRYRATAPAALSFFTDDRAVSGADPWRHLPQSDVIQLHWTPGFLDYKSFFSSIPPDKPVVWTLHGMDALTGGCSFNEDCSNFTTECGSCPQLGSHSGSDLTHQVWKRKKSVYSKLTASRLQIVAPSRWLCDEVQRSSLLKNFTCTVIPYGLDTEVFAPRNRYAAREVLGIPQEVRVILFVADGISVPRKGLHLLTEALSAMEGSSRPFLVALGPGQAPLSKELPLLQLESASNDRFLSSVYSAADLFVAPSLQDNLPCTVLESMACSTPVVGFAVGGIPDLVRPGLTGLLAKPRDSGDLRRAILELLSDRDRLKDMAATCRKVACEEYSLEIQAKRYAALYQQMLERRRP
jgi:glycosyltransferase involved in cell wall biosynthesis